MQFFARKNRFYKKYQQNNLYIIPFKYHELLQNIQKKKKKFFENTQIIKEEVNKKYKYYTHQLNDNIENKKIQNVDTMLFPTKRTYLIRYKNFKINQIEFCSPTIKIKNKNKKHKQLN